MYDYTGHTDCNAPLGVVVHQDTGESVRLPIIDDGLQLYERKVGPTSITRRAEVTVPIEDTSGHNWLQHINGFHTVADFEEDQLLAEYGMAAGSAEQRQTDTPTIQSADIIGQPIGDNGQAVGEPAVLFRGYVGAVGSSEGVNRARFRILDPMKFLSQIEAGTSFSSATVRDVLRYIASEFENKQPIFKDVSIGGKLADSRPATEMLDVRDLLQVFVDPTSTLESSEPSSRELVTDRQQTFSTNRDTLTDVLGWLIERTGTRIWFQPNGKRGLTLTAISDDSQQYDLTPSSDNPPRVIKNNALYEIRPLNAVKLKGNTGTRVEVGGKGVNVPVGNTYPEAVATYPPLVERFGGELSVTNTSKITDAARLEREAESQLKQELDEISGGEMVTTLAPIVRPFDRVEATPACAGVTVNVDSLTYEVQEATHSIVPGDNNVPRTTLSVSMAVDPSKIDVRSTTKDSQTGEEPSESQDDGYEYGYMTAP